MQGIGRRRRLDAPIIPLFLRRLSRLMAGFPGLGRQSSMARGPLLSGIRGRIDKARAMARFGACWRLLAPPMPVIFVNKWLSAAGGVKVWRFPSLVIVNAVFSGEPRFRLDRS